MKRVFHNKRAFYLLIASFCLLAFSTTAHCQLETALGIDLGSTRAQVKQSEKSSLERESPLWYKTKIGDLGIRIFYAFKDNKLEMVFCTPEKYSVEFGVQKPLPKFNKSSLRSAVEEYNTLKNYLMLKLGQPTLIDTFCEVRPGYTFCDEIQNYPADKIPMDKRMFYRTQWNLKDKVVSCMISTVAMFEVVITIMRYPDEDEQ